MGKIFHQPNLMSQVLASKTLNEAFRAVCRHRKKDQPSSDIWGISLQWPSIRKAVGSRCVHLKGNGGLVGGIRRCNHALRHIRDIAT